MRATTDGPKIDLSAIHADIAALLETDIFSSTEAEGPLFKAAYVWLILRLNDLLQDAAKRGIDVRPAFADGEDVVDLIRRARYAIVHNAAGAQRRRSGSAISDGYAVFVGAASGFDDDIAVELAGVRVLIRRHAVDAFEILGQERSPAL